MKIYQEKKKKDEEGKKADTQCAYLNTQYKNYYYRGLYQASGCR